MHKIKLYGIGGQGVVTAARMLCYAFSMYEDKYAKIVPAYGHERRGAPVFSDIFVDEAPVLINSFVYEPDVVIVLDPYIEDKGIDIGKGIHEDTILVMNHYAWTNERKHKFKSVYLVEATEISLNKFGRAMPNIPMLGAVASTGLVSVEAIQESINVFFKNKENEIYKEMVNDAYETTKRS